jgi:hypothetical protein
MESDHLLRFKVTTDYELSDHMPGFIVITDHAPGDRVSD